MIFKKLLLVTLIVTVLSGITASLEADYYLDTLFPIGLTGLNGTGATPPYGNTGLNWRWTHDEDPDQNEQDLIYNLGINCIGAQDAKPDYLLDFNPETNHSQDNYLYKVCMPSIENDQNPDNDVYLITAGYFIADTPRVYVSCSRKFYVSSPLTDWFYVDSVSRGKNIADSLTLMDSAEIKKPSPIYIQNKWFNTTASSIFRSPHRPAYPGWGSMLFTGIGKCCVTCLGTDSVKYTINGNDTTKVEIFGGQWGAHGSHDYNWNTFDGDSLWRKYVADNAVETFDSFFVEHDSLAKYIWGLNLVTEDPGAYYGASPNWQGCWAAVDRIFNGKNTQFKNLIPHWSDANHKPNHDGIVGVNKTLTGGQRMIFVKSVVPVWEHGNVNVFESLPDIDVVYAFPHGWVHAHWNYGDEQIFDNFLYGIYSHVNVDHEQERGGYQDWGVYFQKYGKTNLREGQKRRWIGVLCLEWNGLTQDGDVTARRPCPPEIRCGTYLALSRGAKGIMFHPWSLATSNNIYPNVPVPCTDTPNTNESTFGAGIRDQYGWPFGDTSSGNSNLAYQVLNDGSGGSTYWHQHPRDSTYYYLKTLIKEIKKLAPTLMQLDWVNGYSLNSTDPNWASPCPHYYLDEVSGVSYMDLALFDHPTEPVGVEYFMLVNREGIADMTNRTVSVALDAGHWPGSDSLTLTDIADKEHPHALTRDGNRFVFTQVFEPGEGKLYRVAPINKPPITMLHN